MVVKCGAKYTDLASDDGGHDVRVLGSHALSCSPAGFLQSLQLGDGGNSDKYWYHYTCCTAAESSAAVCDERHTNYYAFGAADVTTLSKEVNAELAPACATTEYLSQLVLEVHVSDMRFAYTCCSLPGTSTSCSDASTSGVEFQRDFESVHALKDPSLGIDCGSGKYLQKLQLRKVLDDFGADVVSYDYTCCSFTSSPAPTALPTLVPTTAYPTSFPTGSPTDPPTVSPAANPPPTPVPTVVAGMLSTDEAKVLGTTVTGTVTLCIAAALAATIAASSVAAAGLKVHHNLQFNSRAAMQLLSQIQTLAILAKLRATEDEVSKKHARRLALD